MSIRKSFAAASFAAVAILGSAGTASASGADAVGGATASPGVLSGNVIQVPVGIPVNVSGNTIGILSTLLGSSGNVSANY